MSEGSEFDKESECQCVGCSAVRLALARLLRHTDVHSAGETEYERDVIAARAALSGAPSAGEGRDKPHGDAKIESEMMALIEERDAAEEAVSEIYFAITGKSPEWSNLFGFPQAIEEITEAFDLVRAAAKSAALAHSATTSIKLHHDFDLERISLALVQAVDEEFARNEKLRVAYSTDKGYRIATIAAVNRRVLEGWIELVIKPLLLKHASPDRCAKP